MIGPLHFLHVFLDLLIEIKSNIANILNEEIPITILNGALTIIVSQEFANTAGNISIQDIARNTHDTGCIYQVLLIFFPFFLFLITFAIIQIVLSAIQAIYSLKIQGKLAIKANAQYMWHVLRMPVEFFTQRMAGDIENRKSTNASIASTLINTLAPTVLNMIMMIVILKNY